MFQVDGRRRGFALAMNTDMFNAVVYTLEFKVQLILIIFMEHYTGDTLKVGIVKSH